MQTQTAGVTPDIYTHSSLSSAYDRGRGGVGWGQCTRTGSQQRALALGQRRRSVLPGALHIHWLRRRHVQVRAVLCGGRHPGSGAWRKQAH